MEKENIILNMLYENRSRSFGSKYINKHGKPNEVIEAENLENEFKKLVKEILNDNNIQTQILEKFEEFQANHLAEMIFFEKEYYKLGFLDGTNLKEEFRRLKNIKQKSYYYKVEENGNKIPIIMDYEYKFDIATDEDLKEPDISEYTVQENN